MADSTAAGPGAKDGKGTLGFLGRKIGPAPVWLWALVIAGIWFWYTRYGPGAAAGGQAATDPNTGQPYASELAAADQQISDLQTRQTGTGATPPPSPVPGRAGPPPGKNVPPIGRRFARDTDRTSAPAPAAASPAPPTRWRS